MCISFFLFLLLLIFQVENRALRLREAMQQYQDEVIPSSAALKQQQQHHTLQQQPHQLLQEPQHQTQHYGTSQNSNRLHTNIIIEGSVDPGGFKHRVGSLGLNVLSPHEETSHIISTSGLAVSPNGAGGIGGGNAGEWEYFDEAGYIRGGALRSGEDPYIRNRFNQEASDALPSNREIPDTRHPM